MPVQSSSLVLGGGKQENTGGWLAAEAGADWLVGAVVLGCGANGVKWENCGG